MKVIIETEDGTRELEKSEIDAGIWEIIREFARQQGVAVDDLKEITIQVGNDTSQDPS